MSDDEDILLRPIVLSARQRHVARLENQCKEELTTSSVYNLIYTIGSCESIGVEYPVSRNIFMKMFQTMYVPFDNDQKFVGVDDFMIRRNRLCDVIGTETRLELWVRRTNDTEDSISWMACFEGSTTVRMKLISAMKLAIHSHPFDLERRAETMIFADLFLDKNAAVLPTEFDKNEYHQWIFKETDAEFKDTWVTYYRRIAGRKGIVCKRCSPQPITDADGWTMV